MQNTAKALRDVVTVMAGHPIRDAIRSVPGGDIAVVQIKNVDAHAGVEWPAVTRTVLSTRRDPDWLRPGDILFSARGQRNIAVCLDHPPTRAVCSPHFFLIRVNDANVALPDFLAWQMNLPQAQRYFSQSATGSYITSIRRQVLEALPILIPSLDRQRLLVQLAKAAQREKQLTQKLLENRQRELDLVAQNLLA
jgi:restriction endonuclease S subunit